MSGTPFKSERNACWISIYAVHQKRSVLRRSHNKSQTENDEWTCTSTNHTFRRRQEGLAMTTSRLISDNQYMPGELECKTIPVVVYVEAHEDPDKLTGSAGDRTLLTRLCAKPVAIRSHWNNVQLQSTSRKFEFIRVDIVTTVVLISHLFPRSRSSCPRSHAGVANIVKTAWTPSRHAYVLSQGEPNRHLRLPFLPSNQTHASWGQTI